MPCEDGRWVNTRSISIFAFAVLSAFACGPREGPARPTSAKSRAFTALLDATLAQHLADYPSNARDAGLHEHDGKVADYSAEGVRARSARQRKARADLLAVPPAGLSEDEALDRALLV